MGFGGGHNPIPKCPSNPNWGRGDTRSPPPIKHSDSNQSAAPSPIKSGGGFYSLSSRCNVCRTDPGYNAAIFVPPPIL